MHCQRSWLRWNCRPMVRAFWWSPTRSEDKGSLGGPEDRQIQTLLKYGSKTRFRPLYCYPLYCLEKWWQNILICYERFDKSILENMMSGPENTVASWYRAGTSVFIASPTGMTEISWSMELQTAVEIFSCTNSLPGNQQKLPPTHLTNWIWPLPERAAVVVFIFHPIDRMHPWPRFRATPSCLWGHSISFHCNKWPQTMAHRDGPCSQHFNDNFSERLPYVDEQGMLQFLTNEYKTMPSSGSGRMKNTWQAPPMSTWSICPSSSTICTLSVKHCGKYISTYSMENNIALLRWMQIGGLLLMSACPKPKGIWLYCPGWPTISGLLCSDQRTAQYSEK